MPDSPSYSSRFQDPAAIEAYEFKEYGAASYSSLAWQWQRPVIEHIVRDYERANSTPTRLLDFACGTGRVLACLESLVDAAEGIDISAGMVALARQKCQKAQFKVGDILTYSGLLQKPYHIITAFRFLLNVEPGLRLAVLGKLREAIAAPDGRLILNMHGNSHSLRHPAVVWRRWRERSHPGGAMLNEMSPADTRALLQKSGFEVIRQFGFGILPPTLYRTPLRHPAAAVDRLFAGDNIWRNCSIDVMFVCKPY